MRFLRLYQRPPGGLRPANEWHCAKMEPVAVIKADNTRKADFVIYIKRFGRSAQLSLFTHCRNPTVVGQKFNK